MNHTGQMSEELVTKWLYVLRYLPRGTTLCSTILQGKVSLISELSINRSGSVICSQGQFSPVASVPLLHIELMCLKFDSSRLFF